MIWKLLGGVLVLAGLVLAGVTGTASILVLMDRGATDKGMDVALVAIFGGVPFLLGLGVLAGGIALLRIRGR